ncbi:hypothetical protein [Paraburkholderia sp. J10-1]|nr:hypothetical protein [Paraburkholderia sp. J10-1]
MRPDSAECAAAGRFPNQDNAFDAAFDRIREAIDQRVRGAA